MYCVKARLFSPAGCATIRCGLPREAFGVFRLTGDSALAARMVDGLIKSARLEEAA
jgi:hypothetical protein